MFSLENAYVCRRGQCCIKIRCLYSPRRSMWELNFIANSAHSSLIISTCSIALTTIATISVIIIYTIIINNIIITIVINIVCRWILGKNFQSIIILQDPNDPTRPRCLNRFDYVVYSQVDTLKTATTINYTKLYRPFRTGCSGI